MNKLRVLLLGPPAVYFETSLLRIQRRILRALLYYLACQEGQVTRSDLMLLFWPDEPEKTARRNLRETLSKLRAQLPDPDLLLANQDCIELDAERIYVDVREFHDLCQPALRAAKQFPANMPQAAYQQLGKAISLWRSPQFLAGFSLPASQQFDRWFSSSGQTLEYTRQIALERLAGHAMANGDLETALRWLRAALEADDLNADLHYKVLTCLNNLNRRKEMLHYCQYLRRLYQQDTGGEFPPALVQFCQQAREHTSLVEPALPAPWPASLSTQVPFVGRSQQLQEARLAYQRGGSAVIFGESGAGKTRLIYELYHTLHPAPRIFFAPGRSMQTSLPFQPLIEMLRLSLQPHEWRQLDVNWAAYLVRLLPELAILRPEIQPLHQASAGESRSLLFEAFHQLLLSITNGQRLLLFLDDAQWSDEATLAALAYLVERSFFSRNGLLVIAVRPGEANPHLEEFFSRLQRSSPPLRIDLNQLKGEEIAEMVRYVLGQTPSPAVVERLARDTGGNPLFLLESLRSLLAGTVGGDLDQTLDQLPLAGSLHALLHERLRGLLPQARQVLTAAAVIGSDFTSDLVETVAELGSQAVVDALEGLEKVHLIRPAPFLNPAGGYTFIHEKIREVLLIELSQARRRMLHLRVARGLEARSPAGGYQAAVLASHFEEAGELQSAFHYWLQAGLHARRLVSKVEAYAAYARAEKLLPRLSTSLDDAEIYHLYAGWGEMAADLSDLPAMQRIYHTLYRLGELRRNPFLTGCGLSGLADAARSFYKPEEGLAYIERAIPYLEQSDDLYEQMEGYNRKGMIHASLGQLTEAGRSFERALELGSDARETPLCEARVKAEYQLSLVYTLRGRLQSAIELAQKTIAECDRLFYPLGATRARSVLSFARYCRGEYAAALQECEIGLEFAESMQFDRLAAYLHVVAARCYLAMGCLDECWEHLTIGREIAQKYNYVEIISQAYCCEGDLYRQLLDIELAYLAYQQGIFERAYFQNLEVLYRLGFVAVLNGEVDQGLEMIQTCIARARQGGAAALYSMAEVVHLLALLVKGDFGALHRKWRELEEETKSSEMATLAEILSLMAGQFALFEGDLQKARQISRAVIERGAGLPDPWLEMQGHRLMHQTGGREEDEEIEASARRLEALLDEIERHAQHVKLRPVFERFRQKVFSPLA